MGESILRKREEDSRAVYRVRLFVPLAAFKIDYI
jgi:hypothetical protein